MADVVAQQLPRIRSAKLGVDPALWSKIKNGLVPPGGKFLKAVARTYPELRQAIYDYMASKEESLAVPVSKTMEV